MADLETYVTKASPSIEDWLIYNSELFSQLRNGGGVSNSDYAPLVDVNKHAAEAGVSTEEYFAQIQERVGLLGHAVLRLVRSDMDGASHIVVITTS